MRFALAATLALAGKLAGSALGGLSLFALFAYTSVTFTVVSSLFGWAGVAAASVVQAAYITWRDGSVQAASLAAYAAAGALAWVVFRHGRGIGRDFPGIRSLVAFTVAAVAGSVATSIVVSWAGHVEALWASVAVWSRSTAVSVLLLAPPLLVLGVRLLGPWLAPIPGEPRAAAPRRVRLPAPDAALADVDGPVDTSPPSLAGTLGACAAAVAAIAGGEVALGALDPGPGTGWWRLLYLAPLYATARRLGLRGGLLAAGLVALASLVAGTALHPATRPDAADVLSIYGQLLFVWVVGALLGWGAEREGRLLERLVASHERLRQDLHRVVRALTFALEAKDVYTERHLHRVNAYALEVGRRLRLDPAELEVLQIAGTLHDMGKIAVPETILNKPGALTPEEQAVMRRHVEVGARILAGVDGLRAAAPLVLHHHERWDGRTDLPIPGYPRGLAGEAIPLGARIIAVVDAFDAMTTDRPYRRALSTARARRVLDEERGAQFDPRVVDTFLAVVDERPWG